jgi:hypothetical protein
MSYYCFSLHYFAFPRAGTSLKRRKKLSIPGMAEFVNAVEVPKAWNMIILCHIPVVAPAMPHIFSCFVKNATEANPTVAIEEYIIRK